MMGSRGKIDMLECDALVVGSGPGGGVTAYHLAKAGFDVLVLEEGPDTTTEDLLPHSSAEMNRRYRNGALTPCLGASKATYAEARCLGGGSEINSGFFHPPMPEVLEQWRAHTGIMDLTPEALAPHVDEIMSTLSIGYLNGAEGPASLKLKSGADSLGWRSQEIPRWITSTQTTDGGWTHQRHGISATYLEMARRAGARIAAGHKVRTFTTENGRAVMAAGRRMAGYVTTGSFRVRFKRLFLCAGAIETSLILRRSGIKRLVGDSLQLHPMMRLIARFPDAVNEGEFGVPVRQILEFTPRLTLGCSVSALPHLSLWISGPRHDTERLVADHDRMAAYYVLASSDTRGTVRNLPLFDEPIIRYQSSRQDFQTLGDGVNKLGQALFAAGAESLFLPLPGAPEVTSLPGLLDATANFSTLRPEVSAIHLFGACPLGGDARAPLDPYGRVHGTENVFVNDASMLPGGTGVNPQGTLMAIAQRNILQFLDANRP